MSIQTFSRRQVVFKLVQKVTRRATEYTHDFVLNVNMHLRFDITNDIKMKNVKRLQLFRHARSYFMAASRNLITLQHYVVLPLYSIRLNSFFIVVIIIFHGRLLLCTFISTTESSHILRHLVEKLWGNRQVFLCAAQSCFLWTNVSLLEEGK